MPKYHDRHTIPARVFFEILKTKDFSMLLPEDGETVEDLQRVFSQIYEDYFIADGNKEALHYLRAVGKIMALQYTIDVIKSTLEFLCVNKTTEQMRIDIIDALKEGCGIVIDKKADFLQEVHRVLNIEIGIMMNDLNFAKAEIKPYEISDADEFDFYEALVNIGGALPGQNISESMSLAMYQAFKKTAIKQSKKHKK